LNHETSQKLTDGICIKNDGWISDETHIGSGGKRLGLSGLRKWKVAGDAWQPPVLEHILQVHVKEKCCRSAIPVYASLNVTG
jgi:hypothetical protein